MRTKLKSFFIIGLVLLTFPNVTLTGKNSVKSASGANAGQDMISSTGTPAAADYIIYTPYLASPDPDKRTERLQARLEDRTLSIEENRQNIIGKVKGSRETRFPSLYRKLSKWLP